MCLNVIACNHLILSLREAGGPSTSMKPLSGSRYLSDIAFTTSEIEYAYPNRSILPSQRDLSTDWNHGQTKLTRNLSAWTEMQGIHGVTVGLSLEVNQGS